VSASAATSTSDCPAPTVSTTTTSKPAASSRSTMRRAGFASPPGCPREASERMNTASAAPDSAMRMRSPSTAPP
jgi:hypothetical protein